MSKPQVSVAICTCDRADSLAVTLASLRYVSYPTFEVIVVQGPCGDRTAEVLRPYEGSMKVVHIGERNVASSRNLAVAAAAGEIVAFVDDDAIPDGRWLDELVAAFDDPEVAATGGPVFDHTGQRLQARYNLSDRWGDAWIELESRRLDHLDHPDTWFFPYPMCTNSAFRRSQMVAIGGFDESYTFYLEETDVALRLIESGYRVRAQDHGAVHHKFLASHIRNAERITVDRSEVLASRLYFALRHGLPYSDELELWMTYTDFIRRHRADIAAHVESGRVPANALSKFERDVTASYRRAREAHAGPPRTRPVEWFESRRTGFLPFPHPVREARPTRVCLVGPAGAGGDTSGDGPGRLALDLVEAGDLVHLITQSAEEGGTVEFEAGVWLHRIHCGPGDGWPARVLDEIRRIDDVSPVDAVRAWGFDADGLARLSDCGHPIRALDPV